MRRLLWTLAAMLGCSCGPGLAEQRHLVAVSQAGAAQCHRNPRRCSDAQACALAVEKAVGSIQAAQRTRARGVVDSEREITARADEAAARAICERRGIRWAGSSG